MAAPSGERPTWMPGPVETASGYEAFDRFPWSKHRAFLGLLIDTLGGVDALSVPNPVHVGSSTFCRIFFYRRQTARVVDLTQYNSFLASHPEYPSIDRRLLVALYAAKKTVAANGTTTPAAADDDDSLPISSAPEPSQLIVDVVASAPLIDAFDGTPTPLLETDNVPSWQRSAPKNELLVPKGSLPAAGAGDSSTGEPPYSDKFARVIEAIQIGKELEGIRHIPDTVVRQAGITPVGKLKAPKKPWETAADSMTAQVGNLSLLDTEFPPPAEPAEPAEPDANSATDKTKDGAPASS